MENAMKGKVMTEMTEEAQLNMERGVKIQKAFALFKERTGINPQVILRPKGMTKVEWRRLNTKLQFEMDRCTKEVGL
jgi:hypothetical protein